jgi:hypothetical protein
VRRWPQIRAGAIAAAIAFGLIDGCPLPPTGEMPEWEQGIVEPIRSVQRVVEWPVAWIVPTLRVSQRWALYQAPGEHRFRLWIEGAQRDGTWRLLYRAVDPDHAEDADILESARVWGAWNPTDRPPPQYRTFCNWILARALERHPELLAARLRHEKIEIVPGGFESTGQFTFEIARVRGVP